MAKTVCFTFEVLMLLLVSINFCDAVRNCFRQKLRKEQRTQDITAMQQSCTFLNFDDPAGSQKLGAQLTVNRIVFLNGRGKVKEVYLEKFFRGDDSIVYYYASGNKSDVHKRFRADPPEYAEVLDDASVSLNATYGGRMEVRASVYFSDEDKVVDAICVLEKPRRRRKHNLLNDDTNR